MTHVELIDGNSAVLEVVELTLIPVYTAPRLKKGAGTRTTQGKGPDVEYGKGEGTQELNEELSRYYRLGVSQSTWECPGLLTKGKHGAVTQHHDIPLTRIIF